MIASSRAARSAPALVFGFSGLCMTMIAIAISYAALSDAHSSTHVDSGRATGGADLFVPMPDARSTP